MPVQAAPEVFASQLLLLCVFDVLDHVAHALKLLGLLVRNLVAEFLFQRHDQFHGVERIRSQVFDELGVGGDLVAFTPNCSTMMSLTLCSIVFSAMMCSSSYFCCVSMPRFERRQARNRKKLHGHAAIDRKSVVVG